MLKEFKEFALKGNLMDLAVAVIIGAAFGRIVTSLVNDFIIIAFAVFLFIKLLISFKMKEKAAPPVPVQPAPEVVLLEEIRDLLKVR